MALILNERKKIKPDKQGNIKQNKLKGLRVQTGKILKVTGNEAAQYRLRCLKGSLNSHVHLRIGSLTVILEATSYSSSSSLPNLPTVLWIPVSPVSQ